MIDISAEHFAQFQNSVGHEYRAKGKDMFSLLYELEAEAKFSGLHRLMIPPLGEKQLADWEQLEFWFEDITPAVSFEDVMSQRA